MASTLKPDAAPFIPGPSLRGSASTFKPPTPLSHPTQPFYDCPPAFHPPYPYSLSDSSPFLHAPIEYVDPEYHFTDYPGAFAQQLSEIHAVMPCRGFAEQVYGLQDESAYPYDMNHYGDVRTSRKKKKNKKKKTFPRRDYAPETAHHRSSSPVWYRSHIVSGDDDDDNDNDNDGEGMCYVPKPRPKSNNANKSNHNNNSSSSNNKQHKKRSKNRTEEGHVSAPYGAFLSEFTGPKQTESDPKTEKKTKPNPNPKLTNPTPTPQHRSPHPHPSTSFQHDVNVQTEPNTNTCPVEKDAVMEQKILLADMAPGACEEEFLEKKAWRTQKEMKALRRVKGWGGGGV